MSCTDPMVRIAIAAAGGGGDAGGVSTTGVTRSPTLSSSYTVPTQT